MQHAIIAIDITLMIRYLMLRGDKETDKNTKKKTTLKPRNNTPKNSTSKNTRTKLPKQTIAPKHNESSSLLFKLFTGGAILLFIAIGVKYAIDQTINHNPLIGKWRTQTVLGIMEVEFEKNSMSVFGTKTPVSYDIQGQNIIVFDDDIKIGNTYKVIDKDTVSTEAGTHKVVYKRVK